MPTTTTRRKRTTTRNRHKDDGVGKYFGDAWSLAKRTASGLNEIRKLINIETKFFNVATSFTVSTTGTVNCLNQMAQGLDYTNRIGDSIKIQRLKFRAKYLMNTTSTGSILRVLIVRDLYQNGADPTFTNVLGGANPLNPKNFLLQDRFSILVDELLYMGNSGENGGVLVYDIPHEGHIKYTGTTAAATSNGYGSIYLMCVSDEATNLPTFTWNSSLYYTDD